MIWRSSISLWLLVVAYCFEHFHAFNVVNNAQRYSRIRFSQFDVTEITFTVDTATKLLEKWDRQNDVNKIKDALIVEERIEFDSSDFLRSAIRLLNEAAGSERNIDPSTGRVMLGICASNVQEGIGYLKSWVTNLNLPRGLLHGMDEDGVPLALDGAVYIKYNSGGVYTFADIRKSQKGFDALWKPGDAVLELYDGIYRGVYFQVELGDGTFRQYLIPGNLFEEEQTLG